MLPPLAGFHHATSFASDPQTNLEFHARTLGMRLVKQTVNFDEPAAYHFYYSSGLGEPGSLLTTFPGYQHRAAARQNIVVCLTGGAAIQGESEDRFGEKVRAFCDPDGMALEWTRGDGPLRIHVVTLHQANPEPTVGFFTDILGFTRVGSDGVRTRLRAPHLLIDVLRDPSAIRTRFGAGIVHHIAFAIETDQQQAAWREHLMNAGVRVSLVKDRFYFHSIYFREPGGILLEIATRGPGFLIDETEDTLGSGLRLPPWFEPIRAKIEARLKHVV
jgi:glyoxalase family protein